ncbi:MAG: AlpA family phage regulatory protein [Polaromonas sp.]|nr:AlpA family phage regulatory protein [Polaromonas sp.]
MTQTEASKPTEGNPTTTHQDLTLWRLPRVLAHVPVSRSGWWCGVKTGRYPAPIKISKRCVAWRASDIHALISSF